MRLSRLISGFPAVSLFLLAVLLAPQAVFAAAVPSEPGEPCFVTADAAGNPIIPPIDCAYFAVLKKFHAEHIDPATGRLEIGLHSIHDRFRNIVIEPGGTLGGTRETFDSTLRLEAVNGDGESATIEVPAAVVTDTSKYDNSQNGFEKAIQTLETDMRSLRVLVRKNPCFEFLEIIGGTDNGLPSPGSITLNPQSDGVWVAHSTFNVHIRVTYIGSEGGPFEGQSGTFEGVVTVEAAGAQ